MDVEHFVSGAVGAILAAGPSILGTIFWYKRQMQSLTIQLATAKVELNAKQAEIDGKVGQTSIDHDQAISAGLRIQIVDMQTTIREYRAEIVELRKHVFRLYEENIDCNKGQEKLRAEVTILKARLGIDEKTTAQAQPVMGQQQTAAPLAPPSTPTPPNTTGHPEHA